MINDMVSGKSKNHQVLVVLLVLVFIVFLVFVLKKEKQITLTEEDKAKILTQLNEQAQKAPPVPIKTKESIITGMNKDETQLSSEQKAEIVKQSQ
jgi:hypothetical protein